MTARDFTGVARLVRLALRRDRFQLPIWLLALTLVQMASASSVLGLYPTAADLDSVARSSARSPVALATNGIVSGASEGAIVASQTLLILAAAAALMSTVLVIRHTRQNEETGRAELVQASIVGRYALLSAALIVAVGANSVLALLNTAALVSVGLPAYGSLVLGVAIGATGIAFAGVGALAAQVTDGARSANGLAGAAIAIAFVLRAVGDVSGYVSADGLRAVSAWPSWLSPIGWAQQMRPFDDNSWWLLAVLLAFAAVASAAAFGISNHRDVGSGLIAASPGPPRARTWMLSPVGLVWRLQRASLAGWAVGIATIGLAYGAVGDEIDELVGTSGQAAEVFEQLGGEATSLTDGFFATVIGIMAVAVGAYAVQSLLRMRTEEATGRLEPLLGTPVSRPRWMLAHITVVALGVLVLQTVIGVATGLAYGLVTGDVLAATIRLTGAALVYTPAVLVVAGVAVVAFGTVPRWATGIAWGVLAACLLLGQIGRLLGLPAWVLDLSPFTHIPAVPAAPFSTAPLLALSAAAAVLCVVGLALFRRRDVAG